MPKDRFPVLAAPLLFLGYMAVIVMQRQLVTHDATLWIRYGQQLFTGGLERFSFNGGAPPFSPLIWTPGYPFFIGLVNHVCGHPVFSAYFVSAAFATGLTVVVYLATRDLFGMPSARFVFILCGLYPPLFAYATTTVIRPVALFFLYTALYQAQRLLREKKDSAAMLSGFAMGAAVLCRFEFALYAVVVGIILLVNAVRRSPYWRTVALYGITVVMVYAVYAVPLYRVTGYAGLSPYISRLLTQEPFPEKEHVNRENYKKVNLGMRNVLYNGNTASRLNLLNQNKVLVIAPRSDGMRKGNVTPGSSYVRQYVDFLGKILPQLVLKILPLLLLGMYYLFKNRRAGLLSPFAGMAAATVVIFPIVGGKIGSPRYYSQLYPYLLMISAYGAAGATDLLLRHFRVRYVRVAGAVVLALFLCAVNLRRMPISYSSEDRMWLQAAAFLERVGQPGDIVFARKRFPAFYAGLRSELLPDEQDLDDVFEYAAYVGAEFLVLDKAITCVAMPQYLPLMGADYPLCLELVHELNPGTDHWCRIFRFK